MTVNIDSILEAAPVVPLVQADDPAIAVKTARALAAGGLTVVEVVFRTDRALDCLKAVADEVPEMIAGAGTVLSAKQADAAFAAARSSSSRPDLMMMSSQLRRIAAFPSIRASLRPAKSSTPSTSGCRVVKFFPASIAGGVPALKAIVERISHHALHANRWRIARQPRRISFSASGTRLWWQLADAGRCDSGR